MHDLALGRLVRMVRKRRHLRQEDVAVRAGVSQSVVSLLECGRAEELAIRTARRVCSALEIELGFEARWRGPALDRLRDAVHARVVEGVVRQLRADGWEVIVEQGFNHFGERGSVDVVGWHAAPRTLLIVEVKSELLDLQDLLASLDRKRRVVPLELAQERGWRPAAVGVVLVVADARTARRVVERHPAMFDAALPSRTVAVRRWLRHPAGDIRGIWFYAVGTEAQPPQSPAGVTAARGN
jgi:transcriptional regulator with XRE-family HTH domain